MQHRAVTVLVLLLLGFSGCGETPAVENIAARRQRIVNGTREPQNTFLTASQTKSVIFLTDGAQEFCSGTLIGPRAVVTAQHCVDHETASSFYVGLGTLPSAPEALLPLSAVHEHPSLDFALVVLGVDATTVVPDVVPIDMNRDSVNAGWIGRPVDAAGYGQITANRGTMDGRFFASVTVISSDNKYVDVDGGGVEGICYGDSGGPVLWQPDALTPPVVVGAESYGDPSCVDVDHLTRVDLAAPWVDSILGAGLPPEVEPCSIPNDDGRCVDGVAEICLAGYLRRENCGSFGMTCGYLGTGFGCLPASCGTIDARGQCDGDILSWCRPTGLSTRDCGFIHQQCVWYDDTVGYSCAGCYTCNGVCADLRTSVQHCGTCDQPCAPAHAVGQCVKGACTLAKCNKGYLDDNLDPLDGCELKAPDEGCAAARGVPVVSLLLLGLARRRRRSASILT